MLFKVVLEYFYIIQIFVYIYIYIHNVCNILELLFPLLCFFNSDCVVNGAGYYAIEIHSHTQTHIHRHNA